MAGNSRDMSTEGLSPEYMARRADLPICVVCERPMRPAHEKLVDWPATVAYATTEQCKSCYNRKYVKPLSAADVLRPPKKLSKARRRGEQVSVVRLDLPRAEVAERWTEQERSAALQVCEMALRGEPSVLGERREAGDLMEMLGLFELDRAAGYGDPEEQRRTFAG